MAAEKKDRRKKPAYLAVRRFWGRNPKTSVKVNMKAKTDRTKCRGKVKPGGDMCADAKAA